MPEHYDFSVWIPQCPTTVSPGGARLSTTVAYGILTLVALSLTVAVGARYNSVLLLEQRVRTQGVSNSLWLLFFISEALTFASRGVYMFLGPRSWVASEAAGISSAVFQGIAVLCCSLALNHQRAHRSSPESTAASPHGYGVNQEPPPDQAPENARLLPTPDSGSGGSGHGIPTPPGAPASRSFRALLWALVPTPAEATLVILFILHYVVLFLHETYLHASSWSIWAYVGSSLLQYLPIFILALIVISQTKFGPRPVAKTILALACVCHVASFEPIYTWGVLLPSSCIPALKVLSYFDVVLVVPLAAAMGLYFAFLVLEFRRQKEECMYQFLRHQDDDITYKTF